MLWVVGDGDRAVGHRHAAPHLVLCCDHHGLCVPGQGASSGHRGGWGAPQPEGSSQPGPPLPLPGSTAQGKAGCCPRSTPRPWSVAAASVYTGAPACPPGSPQHVPHPHIPTGPSGFLLSPFPRSPPHWPSSGSTAGPASPANMCQAQGCHPPELGVQGDSRGCWAPGRHPPRGQPRTSIPGLLCIVPGPGPTGSPADPTLFLGLLGALWAVGQLRETSCPERVSQAGVRRVVESAGRPPPRAPAPQSPDPPHEPAPGPSVEATHLGAAGGGWGAGQDVQVS